MGETIFIVIMFIFILFWSESFFVAFVGTAILMGVFGLDFNLKVAINNIEEAAAEHQTLTPAEKEKYLTGLPEFLETIPDGRITDKLRNAENVNVNYAEDVQACKSSGRCFSAEFKKREGTVYACELNGINCYVVNYGNNAHSQ